MSTIAAIRGFFAIPAGTKPSQCDRCGQTIYWIQHQCKPKRKGEIGKIKPIPISVKDNIHAIVPTDTTWGQGPSHFSDCLFADMYRKGKP